MPVQAGFLLGADYFGGQSSTMISRLRLVKPCVAAHFLTLKDCRWRSGRIARECGICWVRVAL